MTSQKIMLNFSDLKNLSSAEIAEAISPQTAVEVTLKSIQGCEVSQEEIYKTWSKSLFKSYGPSGITDTDLNALIDSFQVAIKELLDKCQDCQNHEQVFRLSAFLNYSLDLFTWIRSAANDFETNKITMFICFGLFSINNYLVVLSKQTSRTVRILIEKTLEIHSLILGILAEHPKTFVFDSNQNGMDSLMSGLCSVGEITPKLDIKAAVETWKCITRLASLNVINGQSEDDVVWLSKPMSFLIKEVGRNVQTVYTQDSLSEPIVHIEKYLKVTNFYLRLLQKLTNDFRHVPFPICEELIGTLAVVFNPPVYIANNAQINKVVKNYIGKELKELIPFAYRNDKYFEHLRTEDCVKINSFDAIQEVVLQTIKVIIRKNESKYLDTNLLAALLTYITESSMNIPKTKHKRFVKALVSLQLNFSHEDVNIQLISKILDDDTAEALAAIEIISTTFVLWDQSTRLSCLKFWIDINESFATFSNSIRALHTELLLKNLYATLSSREKDDIWKSPHTFKQKRFLLTIGLENIPLSPAKQAIIKHLRNELMRILKEGLTVDNYYAIVKKLKLLKQTDFQNDELNEILFQYLEIAIENKKFYLIVESILDFFAPRIGYIDGNKLQRILPILTSSINLFDEFSTTLSVKKFIKSISKLSKFEKQSEQILRSMESNEEQTKILEYLEEQSNNKEVDTELCDNLWNELIQKPIEYSIKPSHICRSETGTMNLVKKNPQPQTDIRVILETLENKVNILQTKTQGKQMSLSNLETIQRIILKLKNISKIDCKKN